MEYSGQCHRHIFASGAPQDIGTYFLSHWAPARVVRLEEGRSQLSLRQSHTLRYQLVLVHACKPHNKAVTSLAINSEGDILASGVSSQHAVCDLLEPAVMCLCGALMLT